MKSDESTEQMAGETVDTARLPFCPMCEYDLTGLPARHRCPECGFEYDEQTRLWYSKGWNLTYYAVFIGLALATIEEVIVWGVPEELSTVAIVLVCFILTGVAYVFGTGWRKKWVAVTQKGIVYRLWRWKPRLIPWSDVLGIVTEKSKWLCEQGIEYTYSHNVLKLVHLKNVILVDWIVTDDRHIREVIRTIKRKVNRKARQEENERSRS